MAWRKMRRDDKAMTNEELEVFLQENNVGHLATINAGGYPYVIPINYFYESGKFIFHSALAGEKLDNIEANPRVCFEVSAFSGIIENERPCKFGVNYQSVIAYGTAAVVEGDDKLLLLKKFAESFTKGQEISFEEREVEPVAVILMEVERMTGKKQNRN